MKTKGIKALLGLSAVVVILTLVSLSYSRTMGSDWMSYFYPDEIYELGPLDSIVVRIVTMVIPILVFIFALNPNIDYVAKENYIDGKPFKTAIKIVGTCSIIIMNLLSRLIYLPGAGKIALIKFMGATLELHISIASGIIFMMAAMITVSLNKTALSEYKMANEERTENKLSQTIQHPPHKQIPSNIQQDNRNIQPMMVKRHNSEQASKQISGNAAIQFDIRRLQERGEELSRYIYEKDIVHKKARKKAMGWTIGVICGYVINTATFLAYFFLTNFGSGLNFPQHEFLFSDTYSSLAEANMITIFMSVVLGMIIPLLFVAIPIINFKKAKRIQKELESLKAELNHCSGLIRNLNYQLEYDRMLMEERNALNK